MSGNTRTSGHYFLGLVLCLCVAAVIYLANLYSVQHIEATEQMTWECRADSPGPGLPPKRIVLMRYVRNPHQFIHQEDPTGSFCQAITAMANNQPAVEVVSDVYGNKHQGLIGWHEIRLNGKPFPLSSEFGGSGSDDYAPSKHPLDQDFRKAMHMPQ